jgi:hypothetical protein
MSKVIKLNKKEEKETEILAKRILPKTDFLKVIEHDKLYFNTLNEALEFNVIKQDILSKKCQKVLSSQKRDSIIENIDMLTDWAETKVKVLDMQGKLRVQQTLVDDKITHFENVFLPQFEKEVKEAKENVESSLDKALQILNSKEDYIEDIQKKINYELSWWMKVGDENKKNDEYIVQIYKPLKRLISAYEQKKEAQEKDKKSKK